MTLWSVFFEKDKGNKKASPKNQTSSMLDKGES
jgi:hypothetical protein